MKPLELSINDSRVEDAERIFFAHLQRAKILDLIPDVARLATIFSRFQRDSGLGAFQDAIIGY